MCCCAVTITTNNVNTSNNGNNYRLLHNTNENRACSLVLAVLYNSAIIKMCGQSVCILFLILNVLGWNQNIFKYAGKCHEDHIEI